MIGVCSPLYTSLRLLMILCVCYYRFPSLNKLGVRNTCIDYMLCPLKPESMVDIVFGLWIVRLCIHLFARTGSFRFHSHSQTMQSKYKIGLSKLGWFRQTFVCILFEWSQCKCLFIFPWISNQNTDCWSIYMLPCTCINDTSLILCKSPNGSGIDF